MSVLSALTGPRRAAHLPVEALRSVGRFSEHVRGHIVFATDPLLDHLDAEDWTERLAAVEWGDGRALTEDGLTR